MKFFHDKVIYQLYPKSFKDSNGDGIGDIQGIISEIDYLVNLGIDQIWMNPIFISPQNDNGYDIEDYYKIDPVFGTMQDLEELVFKLSKHNIGIMFDMVFNHTSTAHEWFQKALAGEKKYQDYYIIRDPKSDGSLPTNWVSKFGGNAWQPFGDTGKYYLNLYDPTQADLNWRNPEVRKEMHKIVNFWLDKGIKGFRFDVLNVIGKDEVLIDSTGDITQEKSLYTDKPVVHEYINEMRDATFGKFADVITVGEMSSTSIENGILYTAENRDELSMIFSFHHLKVDYKDGEKWSAAEFDFKALKKILNEWQLGMQEGAGWNALFWNNHDQPRANSRFGNVKKYPFETATMLAQSIQLLRGTPYIYQGEEIGMTDPEFDDISDYVDVETINAWPELIADGYSEKEAIEIIKTKSRDNSRTPMQWNAVPNEGFTTGKPWLKVADNYREVNVENELAKDNGILAYYKKLIQLRKQYPVISEGTYEPIQLGHDSIFAYIRRSENQILLVLNNFYEIDSTIDLTREKSLQKIFDGENLAASVKSTKIIGNGTLDVLTSKITLDPYETVAFLIE